MADPFDGFGPDAMSFLAGLAADNSKAYFDAHRAVYDTQVATPLKSLVVALGDRIAEELDPRISYEPRIGRSLFRINRDLRFSADTTPYHTHLDAVFWHGESSRTDPAYMLRITADDVYTGVGCFGLKGERLGSYRAAIAGDPGAELVAAVDGVRAEWPDAALGEATRKRVPPGFDVDHPRADFLRRDSFHLGVTRPTPPEISDASLVDGLVERFAVVAPVHRWLVANT